MGFPDMPYFRVEFTFRLMVVTDTFYLFAGALSFTIEGTMMFCALRACVDHSGENLRMHARNNLDVVLLNETVKSVIADGLWKT